MNIPAFLTGLGIRQKLAVMLVVPLLGLLYFATSGVVERLGTLHQPGDLQDNAALAVKVSGLVHELQRERGTTVLFLGSKGKDFGQDLSDQRTLTDQKLKELLQYLQTFDANRFGKPYANRLDTAVGGLGSNNDDDTFNTLLGSFQRDPRYQIHRFGSADEGPGRFAYDTYGSIDKAGGWR